MYDYQGIFRCISENGTGTSSIKNRYHYKTIIRIPIKKLELMYEKHHIRPISTGRFALRILKHAGFSFMIIAASLLIGIAGYILTEHMQLLDAFLNTAMLLGGMGPVKTDGLSEGGKLFAGIYALYAGLVFIALMSIMLSPVIHRIMHRYNWIDEK